MNYKSNNNSNNSETKFLNQKNSQSNFLNYIQSLDPETILQLSKPDSSEVLKVMEHNIIGMLGNLPSEHFNTMITTSKESMGRLLISAMMSGYFLRNAEQRMDFEQALVMTDSSDDDETEANFNPEL